MTKKSSVATIVAPKTTETLLSLLGDVRKKGVDHAEIYLQGGVAHGAFYEGSRVEELSSSRSTGTGIRLLPGLRDGDDHCVYASSPGVDGGIAESLLRRALENAGVSPLPNAKLRPTPLLHLNEEFAQPETDFMHELDRKLRAASACVKQVTFRYSSSYRVVRILRSDGLSTFEKRNYTRFAAQVVAERDGVVQTGFETEAMQLPLEEFRVVVDPQDVAQAALERALLMLEAAPCPAGRMKVLLSNQAGGTMIHEACGHGLESDTIRKDYSVFRDKIGTRVAPEIVTLIDDPTLPGLWGSYQYDDEGTPSKRTVLIENGILKTYLTDIADSRIGGWSLSGNGRRESYGYMPQPRMSNTFVLPGHTEFGEMLEMAGDGLLVEKMGGGEVNPTSGDFVFYVSEGYLIEGGKKGRPVRGATLIGSGLDALERIVAVGRHLSMDTGTCGKSGQGVPVTDGQPGLLLGEITVGGADTDYA